MSFLPVSEALLRLEFEGLLESRPRAGTRVRIPSPDDVRGHYLVREILETQAARLFAEVATKAERAALRQDGRARRRGCRSGKNRAPYLALHHELHRRIAECARCRARCRPPSSRPARCRPRGSVVLPRPAAVRAPRRHRDLAKALTTGTPARAAPPMRQHVQWSQQEALERLKPYFRMRKAQRPDVLPERRAHVRRFRVTPGGRRC